MAYIPLKQNYPTIKINREVKRGPLEYLAPLANALVAGQGMKLKSEMFAHKLAEMQRQRDLVQADRSALQNYLGTMSQPTPQYASPFGDIGLPSDDPRMALSGQLQSDQDIQRSALNALLGGHSSPSRALSFAGDLQEFLDPQADALSARDQAYIRNVDSNIDSRALMDTIRQNAAAAKLNQSRARDVGNILDAITESLGEDRRLDRYDPPGYELARDLRGKEALSAYGIDPTNQDWVDLKSGPLTSEILAALGRKEIPANITSRLLAAILGQYQENTPLDLLPTAPPEGAQAAQSALAALVARHSKPKE